MRSIREFSKEDVDKVVKVIINGKGWSYSTISTALRTLKRLVHYVKHKEIIDRHNARYCYEVEHIHPDRYAKKAMKEEKVYPIQ